MMTPFELLLPMATTFMQVVQPAQPSFAPAPRASAPSAQAAGPAAAAPPATSLPLSPGLPESPGDLPASPDVNSRRILTLEDAQQNAIQNQPMIRQARAATSAGVGRIWEARSGYLPQIIGSASYELTTNTLRSPTSTTTATTMPGMPVTTPPTTSATAASPWALYNVVSAGVTGSQLIYDFGQTSEKWRAADRAADSLKASEKTTINQVVLTARTTFFTARADKALVKVADETLTNELKHLASVAGNVGVGIRPEIDLATEKTTLANDKLALIQAQNNYDIARVQLNVAMGVASNTEYDVADEGLAPIDNEDEGTEQLASKALGNRPEIVSLEKQREADQLTIRSIKGGYGPTLDAIGGLSLADVWGHGTDTGAVPAAYVGVALNWPLFQGGLTTGQVKEAEGNLGVADAQLDQEKLQVRLDVEQARLAVRASKVAITTADEALTNARYQLKLAEKRYAAGVGSIIELGDAQVATTSAGAQRVQADYNLATARAQLLAALGRL
jgi:outer membrane protein